MPRTSGICVTPGCNKPIYPCGGVKRRLCQACYMQWRRHGEPPSRVWTPIKQRLEWLFTDPVFNDMWWTKDDLTMRFGSTRRTIEQYMFALERKGIVERKLTGGEYQRPAEYIYRARGE